jgi:multicomponent Na+:H+ antiporter subunit D
MPAAEQSLLAALVVPLAGAALIAAAGRRPNLREAITLFTAVALLACVLCLLPGVLAGGRPALRLAQVLPGLDLALRLEPLGMLFALIASGLWIVNSLYSIGYMRANDEAQQTRFYVCFALALAATMGIALAGNLFTLFLFYEMLTLVTYPLVTHHGSDDARRGGRVYLGVLMGTSIVFLLPALVFIWLAAGTTDFEAGGILSDRLGHGALAVLLALCMFGIGKAALMPVHRWLPAAMVAPTPVSALLHAVAVVKAGVFCVLKLIVYVFGLDTLASSGLHGAADWLVVVAGFTIVAASVVALHADNLKRRLAYSTVSQLAYVVMAAALLAPLSVIGAALHIAAHALGKITLFFAAGSIYTAAHKTEVSQLDGIGRRMPWTLGAFAVGALSMIGLPPAAGFVSKWYMLSGAMASQHWLAVVVIALSTLLNAGYFLPIIYRAFFVAPRPDAHAHGEAPLPMLIASTLTAAGTVALFFVPGLPLALARQLAPAGG